MKRRLLRSLLVVLTFGLFSPLAQAKDTVKVGVVGEIWEDVWSEVAKEAEKEDIDIEVILFTDYIQPNEALANGSIDLNSFQHIAFLNEWNENNKKDLKPIGFTIMSPTFYFSDKLDSLDDLKDGDIIAIPNEVTTQGRSLLALDFAGVIKLKDGVGTLATLDDIEENPKNIQFEELDNAQLAQVLPDVAASAVGAQFAVDSGLDLNEAIYTDSDHLKEMPDERKNVIVAKKEDKDNPVYKRVVELFQTEDIKGYIEKVSDGQYVPVW